MESLPQILVSSDGKRVDREGFPARRAEMLCLLKEHIYGKCAYVPDSLEFKKISVERANASVGLKRVRAVIEGNHSIGFLYYYAKNEFNRPVIIYVGIQQHTTDSGFIKTGDIGDTEPDCNCLPVKYMIERGYNVVFMPVEDIAKDEPGGRSTGLFGLFRKNKQDCGVIAAWAWGVSRVVDYLSTEASADRCRIGVAGYSRGGKTALVAGASDTRLAFAFSNNSGTCGAAIIRDAKGESIEDINTVFPHWFVDKFKDYNQNLQSLPVDQHMLLACIAPRLLYVASAYDDVWASPENEFLACRLASEAYQLIGESGLIAPDTPELNIPYHKGKIGYHIRDGKHFITYRDWKKFLDFLSDKL